MKVTVILDCSPDFEPAARYALATMLGLAGLPFELAARENTGPERTLILYYGRDEGRSSNADVAILATDAPASPDEPPAEETPAGVRVPCDLVRAAFELLTEWEAPTTAHATPLVNACAWRVSDLLTAAAKRRGLPLLRVWPWPHGRELAVALGHDVDQTEVHNPTNGLRLLSQTLRRPEWRGTVRGLYYTARGLWGRVARRGPDPAWQFGRILAFEEEVGVRSSFYFVPTTTSAGRDPAYDVASPHVREMISRLKAGGWEVGVHGSFHSFADAAQLRRERERLGEIAGALATGIRQHYLRLDAAHTFRAQGEAGFTYDATLGYPDDVGFRAGAAIPFHPFDAEQHAALPLLELPLTASDGALFWRLGLSPEQAVARVLALLGACRQQRGLAALLWHQRVANERRYPGWWRAYEEIVRGVQREGRAWVAPGAEIARWWLARERMQIDADVGEDGRVRWACHTADAMQGLTLRVWPGDGGIAGLEGAKAKVEADDSGETTLRLGNLSPGQRFQVEIA